MNAGACTCWRPGMGFLLELEVRAVVSCPACVLRTQSSARVLTALKCYITKI